MSAIEKLGRKVAALQLDAGNVRSFDTFFGQVKGLLKDHYGAEKFDIIINNAGVGVHALFTETTEEQFARFSAPGYSAYAAMKGGIEVLTRYQAKELGARGIRANCVAPGAIKSVTALGRAGLPTDIGGAVAFLCTDDAGWINGQRIEVSGGMNL